MNAKSPHPVPDRLPELLELLSDLVRSKAKMVDVERVLAGRRADLSRQKEKTPDFPSAWQSIQRGVASGERELSRAGKEYQQHSENFVSLVSQLSNPIGDFIANIVRDASPGHRTGAAAPNAPAGAPTGPKAAQNTQIRPIEARLTELEKKQQAMATQTASELQALQTAMKAVTTERQELREKDKAMSQKEKAVNDLLEDHKNLVAEHQTLSEKCTQLETQNKELFSKNSRFEEQLEATRKSYEGLHKKADRPHPENKKLRNDINETKSKLESITKEHSLSEDRRQKASAAARADYKALSDNHMKMIRRVSSLESRVTATEKDIANKTSEDLEGNNKPHTSEKSSADISEEIRQATAKLSSELETVNHLVQSHHALLNDFEPGELDKLWWTIPKIKEESTRLKEQVSSLESQHNELRAEFQDGKQNTSGVTPSHTSAPALQRTPTPSSAVENTPHTPTSDTTRKAEEAFKRVEDLKKAQDGIIRGIGGMIENARSEVKDAEKRTGAVLASVKERLDALEKGPNEVNGHPTNTGTDKDLAETRHTLRCLSDQHSTLDKIVREGFAEHSDRLEGLQQIYLHWQDQAANAPAMSSPSSASLPNLRPPARPGMVRQTSSYHETNRRTNGDMNGSVKRRRMESPHQNGAPPVTNGNGGH